MDPRIARARGHRRLNRPGRGPITEAMDRNVGRFRIFFWQKLVPLIVLPVFVGFFALSPATSGWSRRTWLVAGAVLAVAVALYLFNVWRKSVVLLDADGLTIYGADGLETWRYFDLLKVRRFGEYRVRMCFDVGLSDQHMHVTLDVFGADAFVAALLFGYEEATGHPLVMPEEHASAA